MNTCKFNLESYGSTLLERVLPISKEEGIPESEIKNKILKAISEVSESFGIDETMIKEAYQIFDEFFFIDFADNGIPVEEEIKTAMVSWKNVPKEPKEDVSTRKLNNIEKNILKIKEDPVESFYGRALKAKIRAQQKISKTLVLSVLFTDEKIIDGVDDLRQSIKTQQEKLFLKVLLFLKEKGAFIEVLPQTLYNEHGEYTGVMELIESNFENYFKYSYNELNNLFNSKKYDTLDSISAYVTLINFDTILKNSFGKAIQIDPDKSKYNYTKYNFGGGSNVYSTWRTNEEIDLSKEINNITKIIVTSLPYGDRNLKFNEFLYIVSKIKDLPTHMKKDFIIESLELSDEASKLLNGQSFFKSIILMRDNPLEYLPAIFEALNNYDIFSKLKESVDLNYFNPIDTKLLKTIDDGLFSSNNEKSLFSIQNNSGFKNTNYFSFICQTIDSTFKSSFLLYFVNDDGEIITRTMYDLSINSIEYKIKDSINYTMNNIDKEINSLEIVDDLKEKNLIDLGLTGIKPITLNGETYNVSINSKEYFIRDNDGNTVTDKNTIDLIIEKVKSDYGTPSLVTFTIKDFYKGPLKVNVNLVDGKIEYTVNGLKYEFIDENDYNSLSKLIENKLKLNFNIDPEFFEEYKNRTINYSEDLNGYGVVTKHLMLLVSRVISNQYISKIYLQPLKNYSSIKSKIDLIYKDRVKITYNGDLEEINFVTSLDEGIISELAFAKGVTTGKLTSSQILDGDGNALSSNNLSRLLSSVLFLIEKQVKTENAAARDFLLWRPGVYRGVHQLKEFKNRKTQSTKSHTKFSTKEMETALVFIDFVLGLLTGKTTTSPLGDGIISFYPSENSDKSFVGRLLVDIKKVLLDDGTSLFENWDNYNKILELTYSELGKFYKRAKENIDNEWKKVQDLVDIEINKHNKQVLETGEGNTIIRNNISYGNWETINELAKAKGVTPLALVNTLVTNYNFNNPFNQIVLIDLVHYVSNKNGELGVNGTLLSNLERFSSLERFLSFMKEQEYKVLENLLSEKLNPNSNKDIKFLLKDSKWIDKYTDKVILGYSGATPIKTLLDLKLVTNPESIELNPLVKSYNILNYLFTLEYINSSVGANYAHPNKKNKFFDLNIDLSKEGILDEDKRKLALDKRNVSLTAQMHSFILDLLQGIPSEITIAIIPDVYDEFTTISGEKFKITPYDGASISNPFFQILLNYSLGGAKVGLIKKTFIHFYDEKTGTGGIIKDAEYPLTNEFIRRSKRYLILMQNMSDRPWRNRDGSLAEVDITTDYTGNAISFENPNCINLGQNYFRDKNTGKYYALWIKKGDSPNTYTRIVQEVDQNGMAKEAEAHEELDENGEVKKYYVNTNYKLWNLLGGAYSMEIKLGSKVLTYSEHSINQVVKIMNLTKSNNDNSVIPNNVKTQNDLWQPLKHSDILVMVTQGAIKQGAGNMNNLSVYTIADSSKVNTMRIKMYLAGVQLDKEHHADGEELSIMTLVISACAARGYTLQLQQELYEALGSLARAGAKPYISAFLEFFKSSINPNSSKEDLRKARENFDNVILDVLIKALVNSKNDSDTIKIVSQELINRAKEGKEISFANLKVPFSDPGIMRKLHSIISVALTKACIKIKIDGNLAVLCPSYGITKIYNDKMYDQYLNENEIVLAQAEQDLDDNYNLINKPEEIKIGRTYKLKKKLSNDEDITLKTIKSWDDYYEVRSTLSLYESIRELFAPLRKKVKKENTLIDPNTLENTILSHVGTWNDKFKKAKELGLEIDLDLSPRSVTEYISLNFPKLHPSLFKKELSYNSEDYKILKGIIDSSGAKSFARAAEIVYADMDEGFKNMTDTQEIAGIIEDMVSSATKASDLYRVTEYNRLYEALAEYQRYYDEEEEYLEKTAEVIEFEGGRELGSYNLIFEGNITPYTPTELIITGNPSTTSLVASLIGGIDALRHPDANGMHFGNPFTHLKSEVEKGKASIFVPTIKEAVINFEKWLRGTDFLDIEPERRQWIINQINSGVLEGKKIVYYTDHSEDVEGLHYYNPKTFPNHAHILQKLIDENAQQSKEAGIFSLTISKKFNLYDLESVRELYELRKLLIPDKKAINKALEKLLNDLNILYSGNGRVLTYKGYVNITKLVRVDPYEIIMPKLFATIFGLEVEDNLSDIKNNPEFFVRKLLNSIQEIKTPNYTLALQRIGKQGHIYLLNSNDAVASETFRPKEILRNRIDGKLYRVIDGDPVYELGENDLVWESIQPDGTITEVIVSDDIYKYIDSFSFATVHINQNQSILNQEEIINNLKESKNKQVKKYIEALNKLMELGDEETLDLAIDDVQNVSLINLDTHPLGELIKSEGSKIHASFLKSLEVVAARIPAQSMLSFMPMKVVGFERSDINTAYVSTTLFLFLGSDLDIDAVSLASFAFDESGKYIMHSPLANINTLLLLKASLNFPYPTGEILEIDDDNKFDYSEIIASNRNEDKPFFIEAGGFIQFNNKTEKSILLLADFIRMCNKKGHIPSAMDPSMSLAVNSIRKYINDHNDYINTSKNVEAFTKNYIVSTMYDIGISPANLIESQQALDSITSPLKKAADGTYKARLEESIGNNPADFTTNIRGFIQNMDGKEGVGICAVGLKNFFAITARYNEVLANGSREEIERLRSDVEIAKKKFKIAANVYTTNEVNKAILKEVLYLLDQGTDLALILSALLSLATDNAKELAISKLNASNMLGMYIYGICIGMDFNTLALLIGSETGVVINDLFKDDVFSGLKGKNIDQIFDYIELGPSFIKPKEIDESSFKYLEKGNLHKLAWNNEESLERRIGLLESIKIYPTSESNVEELGKRLDLIEFNRMVEEAQEYLRIVDTIKTDRIGVTLENGTQYLIHYDGVHLNDSVYGNLKKLSAGGNELRKSGQMLHINQGNYTSYAESLSFISTIEHAISDKKYTMFRGEKRQSKKKLLEGVESSDPQDLSSNYIFNLHEFLFNYGYRQAVIDVYDGKINKELFIKNKSYRKFFKLIYSKITDNEDYELQYNKISEIIKPIKTFFNILDILQVPHYLEYLISTDLLHQYMQASFKYRAITDIGQFASSYLGIHSKNDLESLYNRVEHLVDRIVRDKFFTFKNISFKIPQGLDYFILDTINDKIIRTNSKSSVTPISLGTREGNASFKLLMEEKIIPELKKKYPENKFIQSLGITIFDQNPEFTSTINIAPNINMSPRSDADLMLFEEIKHDFNDMLSYGYTYKLGDQTFDLIELFYYYNLIAFNGRVGENTLTNIFKDIQDYGIIKLYRDFESELDKTGILKICDENGKNGNITKDTIIRELAIKSNPFDTYMKYYYGSNPNTRKTTFMLKNFKEVIEVEGESMHVGKFTPMPMKYMNDRELRNYVTLSNDTDILEYSDKKISLLIKKGVIKEFILKNPDGTLKTINVENDPFFKNLPTISRISSEGIITTYNMNEIRSKIEEAISCSI